jgi:hypothetical protein
VVSHISFGKVFHRKVAAMSNLLSPYAFVHTLGVVKSDLVPDLKDLDGLWTCISSGRYMGAFCIRVLNTYNKSLY